MSMYKTNGNTDIEVNPIKWFVIVYISTEVSACTLTQYQYIAAGCCKAPLNNGGVSRGYMHILIIKM